MTDRPIRILHVDDQPDFTDLTATYLERKDGSFSITTAKSADEGIELLRESDFDCIISDYDMPGKTGLDFLKAVRENYPTLPFILFTGKGSEEVAGKAISAGATDYLQKNAGSDQYSLLANRIRNYTDNSHAQRQRDRQLEAMENAREPISILNDDGEFVYVNMAFAELYGYSENELLGEHWGLLYPNKDIQSVRERILPTVRAEGYWHGQTTGLRADRSTFVEDHIISTTDRGDLVCIVRNATERDEQERIVQRYETLIRDLSDPVYALDSEGKFTFVNDAFVSLVGYEQERILGETPDLIKNRNDVEIAERNLARLLSSTGPENLVFEVEIQPKEGDPIYCEDHMGVLPYEGDEFDGSVGVLRDITERKERKRELEQQNARLEEFASVVSHDLRNPLSIAKGRLEFAQDECESDHLDHVESAHERMEDLIEDLLTLAREGETVTNFEQVSLETVAANCHAVSETEVDFRVITDKVVRADRSRLQDLLVNLFSNAIKHNSEDLTITVGDFDGGFFIADDGVGIPESKRDRVLEAGYSTSEDGTGFGFGIIKRIANAHGWEVDVTESESGGARIEITGVEFI